VTREEPKSIVFSTNGNTIVVAKIDLSKTAEKATKWNRRLMVVSAYRNRVCPLHGEELGFPDGPKTAQCPRGHAGPGPMTPCGEEAMNHRGRAPPHPEGAGRRSAH
jgi:hypothetical protein